MTLTLLYQTHSPFARKALVFAHETGIASDIAVVHHETSPTARNEEVFGHNPLGKVPVLLRPGLPALFDSNVICAYFDTIHGGPKLVPKDGEARWQALRLEAVAQGLADAGIAVRWETVRRPAALRYGDLRDGYISKLETSFAWLEAEMDFEADLHIGHIALATTLDWLEFRELPSFRGHPKLSDWFDAFAMRQSMQATPLSGDTVDVQPRPQPAP